MSRSLSALAATAVLLLVGCGAKKNDLAPAACLAGNGAYLRALEAAPAAVRLAEGTPISDCLVPEQDAGQLADIGHEMIVAATKLNSDARRDPGGAATVRLGYLLGAASRGADPIHADLVRRLTAAARFNVNGGALPPEFERAFGRGYTAGRSSG